jgi:hypothetical protein
MISIWKKNKDIQPVQLTIYQAFSNEALFSDENPYEKPVNRAIFTLFILLYVLIGLLQTTNMSSDIYKGIASQIHALIAIYVTMKLGRMGYYVILLLTLLSLLSVCNQVFIQGVSSAVIGVIVYVFSIISINIIRMLVNKNSSQFKSH